MPYEQVGKNEPVCIADEVPFEIPDSWEWVRLYSLVSKEIKRGKSPRYSMQKGVQVFAQKCNVKSGGIDMTLAKYLDPSVFGKYPQEEYLQDQDIIINSTGNGTLGRIGIFQDTDRIDDSVIVPDSHVTVIRLLASVDKNYLLYVLKYYQPYLEKQGEGSTNQTELKPAIISNLFIPIPPAEEQKRIAEKLDDAFPLIENYGKKESALASYNDEFSDQLKKSILQQAIQGKLVPQDENDEPASVLLERIRAEKQKLIKEGKIKRDKHESLIYRRDNSHYEIIDGKERCIDDELPFEIPDSWEWVRLVNIASILGGKRIPAGRKLSTEDTGHIYIRVSDMKNHTVNMDSLLYVPNDIYPLISNYIISKDDIYITVAGTIGAVGKIPVELDGANLTENADRIVFKITNQNWLIDYLCSPFVQSQIADATTKVGQPKLAIKRIENLLVALPPLAEQQRIVEKVDELLSAVKRL